MTGPVSEESFQLPIGGRVDTDTRMPLWLTAGRGSDPTSAVAYGVPFELNWVPAAVADSSSLFLLKPMMALGRQEQKPVSVTDILHVGEAAALSMGALPIGQVDFVFRNQLAVD